MRVNKETCQDLDRALRLEWLETNGRGGFVSGTVAGANTRRYHALLLVARRPPADRVALVNHLEEWVEAEGQVVPLSTNLYPGAVHPDGYRRCTGFSTEPWPTWTFDIQGVPVQREIFCLRGRDIVVVRWRRKNGSDPPLSLRVRPMLTGREYHTMHHENGALFPQAAIGDGYASWSPYGDLPSVRAVHNGAYRHQPDWYRRVHYPVEQERGLDHEEDWWSPGELAFQLVPDRPAWLVLTAELIEAADVEALAEEERRRRERAVAHAPKGDQLVRALWSATDAYLSDRGKRQTVVAGYPWFTDWGRDTFISLPGLCLATGRFDVARQVIDAFAAHVSQGMIPNRFPDADERPEYNTIDASLWFVDAVGRYWEVTKDERSVRQTAWPAVRKILDGYREGTRYGIRLDSDGLILGGLPGTQLTWMDAKVGDWVVTPRRGKPVEIQALWVRALTVGEAFATQFGDLAYAARCREDRERARASFRTRFWYEAGGYLYDVIDGPDGDDPSLRPNQLYAVSLNDGLLGREQAKRVVQVVQEHLLTPVGLRTLAPADPRYRARYEGGVTERDGAYHQGTVWPFLLGPFLTAWIKVNGKTAAAKKNARMFLRGIERHLGEACLGQISEIFDAEAPHQPRGCPAQAWSVAEPLRVLTEDLAAADMLRKPSVPGGAGSRPTGRTASAKRSRKKGDR